MGGEGNAGVLITQSKQARNARLLWHLFKQTGTCWTHQGTFWNAWQLMGVLRRQARTEGPGGVGTKPLEQWVGREPGEELLDRVVAKCDTLAASALSAAAVNVACFQEKVA